MKSGDKKKALVVDNDEQVLANFQSSLEEIGFDAQVTWSGRDALSVLESERFDLLLVDGYLPDLHVTEFLDRVGRLKAHPMIVVMQGAAPKRMVMRRYEGLGVYAVVDKRDPAAVYRAVLDCRSAQLKRLTKERVAGREQHA